MAEECPEMDKALTECSNPVASPDRRKLEPSLQAWAASRHVAMVPRNVAASEGQQDVACPRSGQGHGHKDEERGRQRQRHAWQGTVPDEFNLSVSRSQRGTDDEPQALKSCGEWPKSLRESRSLSWTPQVTVPRGPYLRTAHRSRSRSASSSRGSTPLGTPQRFGTPRSQLPAHEQLAVEHHLERMAAARLLSASPLRRQLAFGSHVDGVAQSPARSSSSRSCGELSTDSRLSQLSRPRTLSRPRPSSEEMERLRAKAEVKAIKEQMRRNERSCKAAILNPDTILGVSEKRCARVPLTMPMAPDLHTAFRAARTRSESWHSSRHGDAQRRGGAEWWRGFVNDSIPREKAAIERHMGRSEAAYTAAHATVSPVVHVASAPRPKPTMQVPEDADLDVWAQEALDAEDRAQRAKAALQARRENAFAEERQRLYVFKAKKPATASSAKKDVHDKENVIVTGKKEPFMADAAAQ